MPTWCILGEPALGLLQKSRKNMENHPLGREDAGGRVKKPTEEIQVFSKNHYIWAKVKAAGRGSIMCIEGVPGNPETQETQCLIRKVILL